MARNLPCGSELRRGCDLSSDIRGGFSRGVPPLPIPNRAVKPARADGTDTPVGRVGRRRTSGGPDVVMTSGLLFFISPCTLQFFPPGGCASEDIVCIHYVHLHNFIFVYG